MACYILYHFNCPDGFGAAYAAWKKYGADAEYIGVKHGDPPPAMTPNSEVFIVDFAYDRETLLTLSQTHRIQVLDHHKTAQDALKGLDFAIFNLQKSGAVLAWEYFHPDTPVPQLLQYVQDQDLWNWVLPQAHEICTALSLYPYDFEVWDQLHTETLASEGKVALKYKTQLVEDLCQRVQYIEIAGYKVPTVNTPLFSSELGNTLCQRYPDAAFAAAYCDLDGKRKWSLRSIGDFDVSAIAKSFGGGGHPNAAGFSTFPQMDTVLTPPA